MAIGSVTRADQAAALAAAGREGLDGIETTMQQLMDSTASISVKLGVVREKSESINAVVTTITKLVLSPYSAGGAPSITSIDCTDSIGIWLENTLLC